ncbi:hypothetical protein [Leeia oryzae]|uniref:hypothetical protein n=1 Tax=Leeia oryzae TaxID=356662 RepID=UPI000399C4E2|nr:hypothetical protein [Leeia oryzae]
MKTLLSMLVAASFLTSGVAFAADTKKPETPASGVHKMHKKPMHKKPMHKKVMKKHAEKAASK